MPTGSIRALLAFGTSAASLSLSWASATRAEPLLNQPEASEAFVFLQLLMILILAHFFSAHGRTIGAGGRGRPPAQHAARLDPPAAGGYLGLLYCVYHELSSASRANRLMPFLRGDPVGVHRRSRGSPAW
ncbi:MAG: hypothetical protein U0736_08460 [Gemmataceae bacterium]